MRNFLLFTTVVAAGLTASGIEVRAQSYSSPGSGMRYNGPPYGRSDEMTGGSAFNFRPMMGPGYDHSASIGHGPGNARDGRRPGYRGEHTCWKEADSARGFGYYAPCGN
jgi:hypothetical protein